MADRPILFSGAMIRAILAGQKTQTRRLVTPRTSLCDGYPVPRGMWPAFDLAHAWVDPGPSPAGHEGPYLKVPHPARGTVHRIYPRVGCGDRLWVREAAYITPPHSGNVWDNDYRVDHSRGRVVGYAESMDADMRREAVAYGIRRTPPSHMPRWASRLTVEVTRLEVQRDGPSAWTWVLELHAKENTGRYGEVRR